MAFTLLEASKDQFEIPSQQEGKKTVVIYHYQESFSIDDFVDKVPSQFFSRFSLSGGENFFFGLEGWGNGATVVEKDKEIIMEFDFFEPIVALEFVDFCRQVFG